MDLLFRKNKLIEYDKHSGKLCTGFNKCLHPGSVTHTKITGFKDEPDTTRDGCDFLVYTGPAAVKLSEFTKAEFIEFQKQHNLCCHPDEITLIQEWRCYKCGDKVASERERHTSCTN